MMDYGGDASGWGELVAAPINPHVDEQVWPSWWWCQLNDTQNLIEAVELLFGTLSDSHTASPARLCRLNIETQM